MRQQVFSIRTENGAVVSARCRLADSWTTRLRGLLGRKKLNADEGLLLTPGGSIHTCFMRFPIDVVFLECDLTVLGIRQAVKPWRLVGWRGARSVLELPAGTCEQRSLRTGDRLSLSDSADENARVMLVMRQGEDSQVLVGHGPLSAATRTMCAMDELEVGVSAFVLHERDASAG
jgi:uncharacterized protein